MKSSENKIFASKFLRKWLFFDAYILWVTGFFAYIAITEIPKTKPEFSMNFFVLFIIIFVFGFIIKEIFLKSKIIFYENSLEIIDFLGFRRRKFDYHSIQSWSTEQKRSKKMHITWEELSIEFYNWEKVLLKSHDYTNYSQIREQISSVSKNYK